MEYQTTQPSVLRSNRIIAQGNVLIIEDDPDTANFIASFLREQGYGVRSVISRDEALAVLDAYLYDVIIMDYMMPGMGSTQFASQARKRCPHSKFIMISAVSVAQEQAEKLNMEFLAKPFTPEQLLQTIQSLT